MKPYFLPLILPFSHTAFADNQNNDVIETITTTASRIEALSTTLPLSISTLTQAQLNSIAPTHIEEALQRVAGANIQRGKWPRVFTRASLTSAFGRRRLWWHIDFGGWHTT